MAARFLPLFIGIAFAAVIAILVMTPIAWHLMGTPDEAYPELLFLDLGAPPAIILLIAGTTIALAGRRHRGGALQRELRPLWYSMALTLGFAALLMSSLGESVFEIGGQIAVNLVFYVAWPTLAVWTIRETILCLRRTRMNAGD